MNPNQYKYDIVGWTLVGIICIVLFYCCRATWVDAAPTPTTTPTDEQIMAIPENQIKETEAHKDALVSGLHGLVEQLKDQLVYASSSLANALDSSTQETKLSDKLQTQINAQTIELGKQTQCCKDETIANAKKDAAILRRDIVIGGLVLAIGVYLFLKFYVHIPI